MIVPEDIYYLVGRDAYDMVAEWNKQEQERMEAILAEQERIRRLPEECDE